MANSEIPEGLEELFEQTWFDHALHYGLLIGAIFQLVCIAAIVVLPLKAEEEGESSTGNSSPGGMLGSEGAGDTAGGGAVTTGGVSGQKKGGRKARKRK